MKSQNCESLKKIKQFQEGLNTIQLGQSTRALKPKSQKGISGGVSDSKCGPKLQFQIQWFNIALQD